MIIILHITNLKVTLLYYLTIFMFHKCCNIVMRYTQDYITPCVVLRITMVFAIYRLT